MCCLFCPPAAFCLGPVGLVTHTRIQIICLFCHKSLSSLKGDLGRKGETYPSVSYLQFSHTVHFNCPSQGQVNVLAHSTSPICYSLTYSQNGFGHCDCFCHLYCFISIDLYQSERSWLLALDSRGFLRNKGGCSFIKCQSYFSANFGVKVMEARWHTWSTAVAKGFNLPISLYSMFLCSRPLGGDRKSETANVFSVGWLDTA